MNELLQENNALHERLSQLEQKQHPSTNDVQLIDSTSLSSLGSHDDDAIQLQNGFIQKIIVRILLYF